MNYTVINEPPDVSYLYQELLGEDGRIKLMPSSAYKKILPLHLAIWCMQTARYCIPTIETIDWLKSRIGDRSCVEIGSGNGDLSHYLGIQGSDSYIQQRPDIQAYYRTLRQKPTSPPVDILRENANDLVRRIKPQVVIGAWITHRYVGGTIGSMYGPVEEDIIQDVECYIHIGNQRVHGEKTALRLPHQSFQFDWLVSRTLYPHLNKIWMWGK